MVILTGVISKLSQDKIKNLSSRYLGLHIDVIRDTIDSQKESFHQFFNVHIFCTFFKKLLQLLH